METLFIPLAIGAAVVAAFLLGVWFAWDGPTKKNTKRIEALLNASLYSAFDLPLACDIVREAWRDVPHHKLPFDVVNMINSNDAKTFNSHVIEYARDLNAAREVDIT